MEAFSCAGSRRLAFQEQVQHIVVILGDRLDQLQTKCFCLLQQICRNLFDRILRAHGLVIPDDGPHLDQIHQALKLRFRADRNLNRHRTCAQALADGLNHMLEIRARLVHLVDKANPRNLVLVALPPHRLRLRLHAGNRVEQRHRAIQHAQAALHFRGKVHVARSINNVDANIAPGAGRRSRGNRDAALLLLLHVIHGRSPFMHFTDTVRDAGIEQDAFRRCRLSGVNVRHDSDIAATI